jgi:hypothetical protein
MKKALLFLFLALLVSLAMPTVTYAQDETPEPTEEVTEGEAVTEEGEGPEDQPVTVTDEEGETVEAVIMPAGWEPGDDQPTFDVEVITEALLLIFGAAVGISQFVNQMKERGKIGDGDAGKWAKYTGFAVSVSSMILAQIAPPEAVEMAREYALMASGVLATAFVFAGGSKVAHWFGKKIGATSSFSDPTGKLPAKSPAQQKHENRP